MKHSELRKSFFFLYIHANSSVLAATGSTTVRMLRIYFFFIYFFFFIVNNLDKQWPFADDLEQSYLSNRPKAVSVPRLIWLTLLLNQLRIINEFCKNMNNK